jgi:site-specific recombinase XerC
MKGSRKRWGSTVFICLKTRHAFARIVGESSGSMVETQEALGLKNPATACVYLQRIRVKGDKFGPAVAKRMKL